MAFSLLCRNAALKQRRAGHVGPAMNSPAVTVTMEADRSDCRSAQALCTDGKATSGRFDSHPAAPHNERRIADSTESRNSSWKGSCAEIEGCSPGPVLPSISPERAGKAATKMNLCFRGQV